MKQLTQDEWQVMRRRVLLVVANSLNNLLVPIFSVLVSLLVIRSVSAELWGNFVSILIIVQLAAHVLSWGNKEYLLRAFSRTPDHIAPLWQSSLRTRLLLIVGVILILPFLNQPTTRLLWMALWIIALVIQQAYDVVIIYRRDFIFAIGVEIVAIALLLWLIWQRGSVLSLNDLLRWYTLVTSGKAVAYSLRHPLWRKWQGKVEWHYFIAAGPFFLLGLSGMLQSRIDLYSVDALLSANELAQYQVFIGFMLYLQALSAFIITPFIKNLYQSGYATIVRVARWLLLLGIVLVLPGLLAVYGVIRFVYEFDLSLPFYVWGAAYVIPIFYSTPIIYALYKAERQRIVLAVNATALTGNLLLNLSLIPHFGMLGALMATTLVRFGTVSFYFTQGVRLRRMEVITDG